MKRAFTLVEVLLVVSLVGLLFGVVIFSFYRATDSSVTLLTSSELLKQEAILYWELERKILGAKQIHIENDRIYMITTGGNYYSGVVKSAYFVKDKKLYYYEFPYPYLSIDDIDEDAAHEVMSVENFSVSAYNRDSRYKTYTGLPDFVEIRLNGRRLVYKVIK